jgi:AcrR family transcriptional regulator
MTARSAAGAHRRSAEEARDEILRAASAFLASHRFRDLTVGRLMEGTASSRSTFYVYFEDLYQLTDALLVSLRGEFLAAAAPWLAEPEASAETVRAALTGVVGVWQRRGRVLRAIQDAAAQDARLERAFRRTLADLDRAIAQAIRREQGAGSIGDLDADETAAALNRLDLAYLDHCFGRSRRRNTAPVIATLERIWIRTLYGSESAKPGNPRPTSRRETR